MFATGCIFSSQGPESGGVFPDRIRDGERQEMSGGQVCVGGWTHLSPEPWGHKKIHEVQDVDYQYWSEDIRNIENITMLVNGRVALSLSLSLSLSHARCTKQL